MMAEFQEVMKQYKRLLVAHNSGEETPIDVHYPCMMENTEHFEETVMAWAAEHPEPQYQTWSEWFVSMGMLPDKWDSLPPGKLYVGWLPDLMHTPIPADIAEKLGIEPKEGA